MQMTPKSFLVIALAMLPTSGRAESLDAAGIWSGTPANQVHPVSDDLVVIHVTTSHDRFEPVHADHPAANSTGQCFGAVVIRAGQATGSGNCRYQNDAGDVLATTWVVEGVDADGQTYGRWEIIDGTGLWSGASGSGTYRTTQNAEVGYRSELAGEITLN
jgi:hypothetical protein